jgi:hypothetical protein
MDWIRNSDRVTMDIDYPTLQSLSNITGVPVPTGRILDSDKIPILNEVVYWIRNNDPNPDDVD